MDVDDGPTDEDAAGRPARHRRAQSADEQAIDPDREWDGSVRPDWEWAAPATSGEPRSADAGPDANVAEDDALLITRAVRARARAPVPPPRPRSPRRVRALLGLGVAVLAGATAGVLIWLVAPGAGGTEPTAKRSTPSAAAPSAAASLAAASSAAPSGASSTPGSAWPRVLAGLDASRERAFALGDPSRLTETYVPGTLLLQDTAAMRTAAPAGCRVTGLRTTYSAVREVERDHDAVTLTAMAALSRAAVVCGTRTAAAYTKGEPATALRIRLVPSAGGYRIAGLTVGP